ncbi:S8 family serine peptidase [Paenibacillus monticola]|uniref:S8 family serine peptidase n=1 Tax=Paenibacillus monticola TaxID=2666075 RepID=UPI0018A03142|nr:S8 family serine peptidase [Paenibacillus monticola]
MITKQTASGGRLERSGRIAVCIIDDGINEKTFATGKLEYNKEISESLVITDRQHYDKFALNHGTVCAGIIKQQAPGVSFSSVKILTERDKLGGTVDQLIRAIQWCAENEIRIVNLSLGTTSFMDFDKLTACVNEVTEQGLILIAAYHNDERYTVPACLTNVIGVKSSEGIPANQFLFDPYPADGIDITTSGRHSLRSATGEVIETRNFNSFATPFITGVVYRMLSSNFHLDLEAIKKKLYNLSSGNKIKTYNPYLTVNTDWIVKDKASELMNCTVYNEILITNTLTWVSPDFEHDSQQIFKNAKTKVWSSAFYKVYLAQWLKQQQPQADIPAPVLLFRGLQRKEIKLLLSLKALFQQDGFDSKVISDYPGDLIWDIEYMPLEVSDAAFFSFIYSKYLCDLMIVSREAVALDNLESQYDIVLDVLDPPDNDTEQEFSLDPDKECNYLVWVNGDFFKGTVQEMYDYMKQLLLD